jgi:hypothetical protein
MIELTPGLPPGVIGSEAAGTVTTEPWTSPCGGLRCRARPHVDSSP